MQARLDPERGCALCQRLAQYRERNSQDEPDWHNAPVPAFGALDAPLLIVGLAPGRGGANRTGRPFTGDYAGDLLYATLLETGLASGTYGARADDALTLKSCRITNAVRCVPPENKPTPEETRNCRRFLTNEMAAMTHLKAVLALGRIAHDATLRALEAKPSEFPFTHGAQHRLRSGLIVADSFHCSRYNTNTGKLTVAMFRAVFAAIKPILV